MIKLRKITTTPFGANLTFDFDVDDKLLSVEIDANAIDERLKQLRELLGRELTDRDLKDVIIKIINEIRKGEMRIQRFDYSRFIGVDIE